MNLFKNKLIRIILLIIAMGVGVSQTDLPFTIWSNITGVEAAGGLTINWGVPSGQPIFVVNNMMPGDTESRTVGVTNNTSSSLSLAIKGIKVGGSGNLEESLILTISDNGNQIYGPKLLSEFFSESNNPDGIPLLNAAPNSNHTLVFTVYFDTNAGNNKQNTSVIFDLIIGSSSNIPAECQTMRFDRIIYGTENKDHLKGGNKNDLIFGLAGNDSLSGSNGNDCLVGGPGNDRLDGSNGNDFLLGEDGDDILDGSNGLDKMYGGQGDDKLDGSNGNDIILGGEGRDRADGGNGNDQCEAERQTHCE